ncbi:MAG: hypothetical protein IKS23_01980 [Alphaproteobacteria bacterium]|nr:hypothetical protein [Alphaproteobacteria bacterium]
MQEKLQELFKAKEALKEEMKINQIGNDSYYLSPLYREHSHQLRLIESEIESLNQLNLSTDLS